jgi:rhodanese-related sulfurtransferase
MSKRAKKQTARKSVASSRPNVATYFATKLEAEWGPFDLKHALEERGTQIVVLDTRTADAYAEEHITQAVNIPESELEKRLLELPKNKEIVPYCWNITCHLATRVALKLAQKGYRVHELAGGIDRWKDSGFEITSSKKEPASVA